MDKNYSILANAAENGICSEDPWSSEQDRLDVFDALVRLARKGAGVSSTPPIALRFDADHRQKELPHARRLDIRFKNGAMLSILPDQGMGFVKFDDSRTPIKMSEEWAEYLYRLVSGKAARRASTLSNASPLLTHIAVAFK